MFVTASVANAAWPFPDVPAGSYFEDPVEEAVTLNVVDGTQAYFRPADYANRGEMFKMIAASVGLTASTCDESLFPDVSADDWSCGWFTTLYNEGIVTGDGPTSPTPGYGRPNDPINRAEVAKVITLVNELTADAGTLGSDYFTDVAVGSWFDEYVGVARYNCVVLGKTDTTFAPEVNITRAEGVTMVIRALHPTTECGPVVAEGALTVALDGSSPDAVFIPQNGANIPYSVFAFTASAEEDINVEQLIITRLGLGRPGDFKNLKIYVDGVQLGGEKTINTSTNSATFNLTSTPIVVPAGKTVLVEVRADMNGVTGSQNQLCVNMPEDVTAMGDASNAEVAVGGSFAVCGELMSTTSANVGTLTYTVTQPSVADINVGDTDVIFTKVKMDMITEDVNVNRITFKQVGSADPEVFGNVSLWMSGSLYSSNVSWVGDFVTFDLEDAPIFIAKGNSKSVELHADVLGGLASTAGFDIYRDWHIEGTGTVYGYGVNVVEDTVTPSITPVSRNIIGGNVAFSLSANNPVTGDVKKGANDHEFTKFNISTGGDGVSVRKISLDVNGTNWNDITDIKIWAKNKTGTWYVVAGPSNPTGALTETMRFTDTFDILAATTQEFMVTADIANAATAGDVYDIDVSDVNVAANVELEYLSDGTPINVLTDVTGGMLNGNVMTVRTPNVDVTLAATPGPKSYVRNTLDKDLVAFDFKASTADDIRITGITLTCADTSEVVDLVDNDGDGFIDEVSSCHTAFTSLDLFEKDGSTLTLLKSGVAMTNGGTNDTATFSLNYVVPKGTTARLLVRSDILSGAVGDDYLFAILAGGVTAEDSDSSAATVSLLPTLANTITVAPQGNSSVQSVTDSSLQARIVAGLSVDQNVLKVKFSADELEAWYIKDLNFDLAAGVDADVTRLKVRYLDNLGATQTATGTVSGGTVQFTGLNIYVPAGSSQTVDILLDMGDVATGGAVAGDLVQVTFDGTPGLAGEYKAIGASSATLVTDALIDVTSNVLRLAKSYPIVSRTELSTALSNGEKSLYSATIAAADEGNIAVKQLCFSVDYTAGLTLTGYKLFRGSESNDLATTGEVTITSGAGTCTGGAIDEVLVQWENGVVGGEDEVSDATTYVLKGTVAGAASGESINTTLLSDVAGVTNNGAIAGPATPYAFGVTDAMFVWSDLSASPHLSDEYVATSADFLNGYLVEGLSSAGGQVLSQ